MSTLLIDADMRRTDQARGLPGAVSGVPPALGIEGGQLRCPAGEHERVHPAEQAKREHARQPVIEVVAEDFSGRAAGQQIGRGAGEQIAVERAAELPARVCLPAQ